MEVGNINKKQTIKRIRNNSFDKFILEATNKINLKYEQMRKSLN